MGGISSSTTVYVLLLFVGVYVFSISSYTYISSLSNVDLWQKKLNDLQLIRPKRDSLSAAEDNWSQNITFNICCAKNQRMNEKLGCVEAERENFAETFVGILDKFVVDENLTESFINASRVILNFNNSNFLSADKRLVVQWSPRKVASHYISQQDGSLLELNLNRREMLSQFSTSSFCLDRINNTERNFVALVKPCKEKMCINKCCSNGFYYNTVENKCKIYKETGMASYRSTFVDEITETGMNVSYFLIEGVPKCFGPDTMIKINENPSSIFIDHKGYLMVVAELEKLKYFYDNKKYCVDLFSDGSETNTHVNGFYCKNDTMIKYPFANSSVTPNLEPNALKGNQTNITTPLEKIENLMDNIGDAINKVGRKIEEVGVGVKVKASEAGKKAVSGLAKARSSAETFVGSMTLGIVSFLIFVC